MPKIDQRLALAIFRPIHQLQDSNLIDFNCFINQDIKIINSTSHLYNAKTNNVEKKDAIKLTTKEEAAEGNAPDGSYEITAFFKRQDSFNDTKYFSKFSQTNYIGQPTFQNIKNLSFIALHKNGHSNQVSSYTIVPGDIIKLGSVVFKVNQTHLGHSNDESVLSIMKNEVLQGKCKQLTDSNRTCRICLMEHDLSDSSQQLVSICDCKGSCKYVHISCLKTWICNKVQKQQNQHVLSYSLNKLQCQICKKKLPFQIKIKQTLHDLIFVQKPKRPYLMLQKINQQGQNRTIYILMFRKEKVNIGRSYSSDLRLMDISISRSHASIIFNGEIFTINDQGSKYGTMILANKQLQIKEPINIFFKSKLYKFQRINSQKIKI